jgi:glycosyltransferase involved in cell wall biosynthesis
MRAGQMLEALARRFDVHLFVVPVAGGFGQAPDFVRRCTSRIGGLDLAASLDPYYALTARLVDPEERWRAQLAYGNPRLSRFCTGETAERLRAWISEVPIVAVHVMRLYLAPLVQPILRLPASQRPLCVLDLDDDDARTSGRLAELYSAYGSGRAAADEAAEAEKFQSFGRRFIPGFDKVLVCSESDMLRLRPQFPNAILATVPNCWSQVAPVAPHHSSAEGPLRLLFVGTLSYFPNVDAARFLCLELLPVLRRLTHRPIRIEIVGTGDVSAIRRLDIDPAVTIHGFVEDLTPLYAAADVVVVPLRAGGGTRIKILEAFGYGVPVVSTTLGAEGIDAADGEHLLLADESESFARACIRLKDQPEAGRAIAARAATLLEERYRPARIDAELAGVYDRALSTVFNSGKQL